MALQSQYSITLTVDGRLIGVWDKMDGGELAAEIVKYRSGAMGKEEALGGPPSVGDVTLTRLFKRDRDAQELRRFLTARVGKGRSVVTKQPLDIDGNANCPPLVYTGILQAFTPGPADSSATSEADTYDITVSTDGTIG